MNDIDQSTSLSAGINLSSRREGSPAPTSALDPLSFGQESLWFLDQFESGSALYNVPQALRLRGPLDVEALRKAFEMVLERHESLRANFISVQGKPMQFASRPQKFVLPVADLTALSDAEREREIQLRLDEEFRRPFNLAKDLMLRAGLLRLGDKEHILFITLHHIATDAWSIRLLHGELSVLYENFSAEKPDALPELEFQYADFAIYQRELFQGEFAARQIAYWKERLAGELPVLKLPTDRPTPERQTFHGALRHFKFSNTLRNALKELCHSEKVTVFAASLAAFQILLQHYSRQEDILVGCPMAVRTLGKLESLIGYFVNTVVLRGDLSGNPTFREFLHKLNRHIIGALSHQEVPLERLVEELKVPRQPGRNPLVQTCFQYLAEPPASPAFSGIEVELIPIDTHTSKFDLTLVLSEAPDGLLGEVEYNTDLFDNATIDRLVGHYETLLESIVAHPAQKIAELPWLTRKEENQLLVEWNETAAPFPKDLSLVNLLEKQVAAHPESVAVIFENEQVTWRELNERANRLARYLKKIGAQRDELIGICMERSIEMLVAVHGVLKAGAAFFPLDPEYPPERLRYMIEDAQATVLLCQKKFSQLVTREETTVVCLDAGCEAIAAESAENLETKPAIDDLAYVIYTSGSTGQPKGVMVPHRAICNHLFWMQNCFPLADDDCVLQKTSFSFDVAIWELFAPTVSSVPLVMARPEGHRDLAYLVELIAEKKVALLQTTPSALRALLAEPKFQNCKSLKYVMCGGEEMPGDLPEQFAALSDAQLCNAYGPTEAAIDSSFWICSPRNASRPCPIGRPVANAEIYVLDAHLRPVPIGVPGELCVGGRGLARGYWRRPELTAEKFIRHPFSKNQTARLYKTGDLARFLPDGNIEFIGRIDHQVKVRGFRIELGEIETSLRNCPTVREAVVTARAGSSGENQLVAYWVPAPESTANDASLRAYLKTKLPDFMVPAAFVKMDSLPLMPNGKINRHALPAPDFAPAASRFVPPRTLIERQLAEIWADLLRLDRVGVHDNFFDLGGHSLLATQVISRVRFLNHGELSLRELFNSPTIAELSAHLEQKGGAASAAADFEIKPLPRHAASVVLGVLQIFETGTFA
jgi:amino acid adenylation domain-containing protein